MLSVNDINQVDAEFNDIGDEVHHLSEYLKNISSPLPEHESQQYWNDTHICCSAVEKIYTGIERIMSNLAKALDGAPIGKTADGWHQKLMLRMANPYPEVRDRVISEETYELLDTLRGFRHRERNSYISKLDLSIVIDRAKDAIRAVELLKNDVQPFLSPTIGSAVDFH